MRYRITVRRDDPFRTELRGYVDGDAALADLADSLAILDPMCMVIASPASPGYDPFGGPE